MELTHAIPQTGQQRPDRFGDSFWFLADVFRGGTQGQRRPNVAAAITDAARPEQVDENVAASGHSLPAALFEEAERIIA
jgi:hypothetical protein